MYVIIQIVLNKIIANKLELKSYQNSSVYVNEPTQSLLQL